MWSGGKAHITPADLQKVATAFDKYSEILAFCLCYRNITIAYTVGYLVGSRTDIATHLSIVVVVVTIQYNTI